MARDRSKNKSGGMELQTLSPKQADFMFNSDAHINCLVGAVRSGKTVVANFRFLQHILEHPYDEFLVTGKSQKTIKRNVVRGLKRLLMSMGFRDEDIRYSMMGGELEFTYNDVDKLIYLVALKDESSADDIQGMTVAGLYSDEVTTAPKSGFDMAYSRCSVDGSHVFVTCNPDSPYHWFYTDYLKNKELLRKGDLKVWNFLMDDNPYLPKDYVESRKRAYTGVFYQRYILGQWVSAEGAVYPMFNIEDHTFNKAKKNYIDKFISIDYGTSTVAVFQYWARRWCGDTRDRVLCYDLLDEFYHDAGATDIQYTDSELSEQLSRFVGNRQCNRVVVPHDSTSFNNQLMRDGFSIAPVNPDVLEGIKTVQNMLRDNRIRIHESKARDCIKQMQIYSWDSKAQKLGIEKPVKRDDHSPDALRYAVNDEIQSKIQWEEPMFG
jgi:PBSX family phage terminase large subunit